MPYRRLPNTDAARLRAMKTALKMAERYTPADLAFSQKSLHELKVLYTKFSDAIILQKEAFERQVKNSNKYISSQKKLRLYLSHFIQVMNMAIARGELKAEERDYFGLGLNDTKVPPLNTEKDLEYWGKKIIKGEENRKLQGRTPILNPKIELVKIYYDKFMDRKHFQKTLQDNYTRQNNKVALLRPDVDLLIQKIWNEIEEHFRNINNKTDRSLASEYGVMYVLRRNEKKQKFGINNDV